MGTSSSALNPSTVASISHIGLKSRVTCFWMAAAAIETSAALTLPLSETIATCRSNIETSFPSVAAKEHSTYSKKQVLKKITEFRIGQLMELEQGIKRRKTALTCMR